MKYLKLAVVIGLIGLTFIYNARSGAGIVYLNNADFHGIIIIDGDTGQWNYYMAQPIGAENFYDSFGRWLKGIPEKFRPKSIIKPYMQEQGFGKSY